MKPRSYFGRIEYRHARDGVSGGEHFHVSVAGDGTRTVRASCAMWPEALQREVTYTVDADWRPVEAYVRLAIGSAPSGAAWFRFDDLGATCHGWNAAEGRILQRLELGRRPTLFAPHPLVTDGWQASVFDRSGGVGRQHLDACTNSSSRPDGGSGPALGSVHKDLEWCGSERLETPAGRFEADRFLIHPLMPGMRDWPALEFWVAGADCLLLRMHWALTDSTYELVELSGTVR